MALHVEPAVYTEEEEEMEEEEEEEEEDSTAPKFLWSGSGADDGLEAAITASWSKVLTTAKASVLAKRGKRDVAKLAPLSEAPQASAPEPRAQVHGEPAPPAEALTSLLLEAVTAEGRLVPTEVKPVVERIATAERVRSPRSLKLDQLEQRNRELQQANDALAAQNQQLSDTLRGGPRRAFTHRPGTAPVLKCNARHSEPPRCPRHSASRGDGHAAAAARPSHAAPRCRRR